MGWTFMDKRFGADKPSQILLKEYTFETEENRSEVVDSSTYGNQWYAIIRNTFKKENRVTYFGLVCIFSNRKTEFGYKSMSEDMGPYYYNATKKILDKLNQVAPGAVGYAKEWREKCAEVLAKKKSAPKVEWSSGMRVIFGGHEYTLNQPYKRSWIVTNKDGKIYKMSLALLALSAIV